MAVTVGDKVRTMSDAEIARLFRRFFSAAWRMLRKHPEADDEWIKVSGRQVELKSLQVLEGDMNGRDWDWLSEIEKGASDDDAV